MHFLILTALKAEALPIIEVFRLRKDSKTHLYQNNNISLLITGVGRDKTKERLQNLHPIYSNFDQTIVVNMGIAGGNPDQTEIGELYRVNAIFDKKTKQSFIPDILCRHSLVELSLISKNFLSSSFMSSSETIASIGHSGSHNEQSIHSSGLIAKKVDLIKSILLSLDHHALTNNVILSGKEFDLIQRGAAQLYLTKTQDPIQ